MLMYDFFKDKIFQCLGSKAGFSYIIKIIWLGPKMGDAKVQGQPEQKARFPEHTHPT
jgi:hypothetical protein